MPGESIQTLLEPDQIRENPYLQELADEEIRVVFGSREINGGSEERERKNLQIAAAIFAQKYKEQKDKKRLIGSTGKILAKFFDRLDIGVRPTLRQLAEIRLVHEYYQKIFGDEYPSIRRGFLAEHAAMRSVSDSLHKKFAKRYDTDPANAPRVEYPTSTEDRLHKADFIVNLESEIGKNIMVQVKCLPLEPLEGKQRRVLYPIRNLGNITEMMRDIGYAVEDHDEFVGTGERMLALYEENSNTEFAFMILPSPDWEVARFNQLTGLPSEDLTEHVYLELNKNYLS